MVAPVLRSLLALAVAAITGVIAFYVLRPGGFPLLPALLAGAILIFPLHVLLATSLAALLTVLAWWLRAPLAAWIFGFVVLLTAFLALWPALAMWQRASQEGVQLSLSDYLANATNLNMGDPVPERSVEYGTAPGGRKLLLDVWPADQAGPARRPAIVIVHGGGWTAGTRSMAPQWNRWFNALGYHVFDIEYRLTPLERWKDAVGDVKCTLGFVAANAARYRVDPTRISTKGDSAGGHLAMLAAYSMGHPDLPPSCDVAAVPIRSVVNFYGPVDLVLGYETSASAAYARRVLTQFIGGSPQQFPDRYRTVSPLTYIGPKTPPTITFLGTSDRIIRADQAALLDRALAGAGVARETYLLPTNDHGFDINWGGFGTQFARAKIERFLQQYSR